MDAEGLVDVLDAVDGLRADLDESKLGRLPAVWVRPAGLRRDVLGDGWTERVQLRLLVPDSDPRRNRHALLELLDKVTPVVEPDDDPAFATVTRPSTGQPVPALVFTIALLP